MREHSRCVGDIGELELVERIRTLLSYENNDVVCGPGDDAAVVRADEGLLVLTTDNQIEGVHFQLPWISPAMIGRRAVAINASDLDAMGASPRWSLCSLGLPDSTPVAWVEALLGGLRRGGEEFGCPVVGGDVYGHPERIAINMTLTGRLPPGQQPIHRRNARAGDSCWITGYPGRAAVGRQLLQGGYSLAASSIVLHHGQPADAADLAAAEACLSAFLNPAPPVGFGGSLGKRGLVRAALDVSDGLTIDLGRLCRSSGVGVSVDTEILRADEMLRYWQQAGLGDMLDWILAGGEDYQLLCAVATDRASEFSSLAEESGVVARRIGDFVADRELTLWDSGKLVPWRGGWDHFSVTPGSSVSATDGSSG